MFSKPFQSVIKPRFSRPPVKSQYIFLRRKDRMPHQKTAADFEMNVQKRNGQVVACNELRVKESDRQRL